MRDLRDKLANDYGFELEATKTRHEAVRRLMRGAFEHLPAEQHRGIAIGVVSGYIEVATDEPMPREARNHTGRLVKLHDPFEVLDAFGEALSWGAGIGDEYAGDPLALTKYVTGVMHGNGSRAGGSRGRSKMAGVPAETAGQGADNDPRVQGRDP